MKRNANMSRKCHPSILRAYDVRGIYGETFHLEDAYALARAFATNSGAERIATAYDARLSSPPLEQAVCDGLLASGCEVLRLGLGPTPMLYHNALEIGGIMVTASHNPPAYNGMKFVHNSQSLSQAEILDLGKTAASGEYKVGNGSQKQIDGNREYLAYLRQFIANRPLKVAWDLANAAAAAVVPQLIEHIPGEHFVIGGEVDGNFPLHHPDPSKAENMEPLRAEVLKHGCDLGLAFDGDADRLGVVDDCGRVLNPQELAALLIRQVLAKNPGGKIILDIKAGNIARGEVARRGGELIVSPCGHSIIKMKLGESQSLFAAEMSGHLFFADEHPGYDDAIYAALRFLRLFPMGSSTGSPMGERNKLSAMCGELPTTHLFEKDIPCPDEEKSARLKKLRRIIEERGIKCETIDGLRAEDDGGWWLVRASNTEPKLLVVIEGETAATLVEIRNRLTPYLEEVGISID